MFKKWNFSKIVLNDMENDYYQKKLQELYNSYPKCFPTEPYCGFSIGIGWFESIKYLCIELEKLLSKQLDEGKGFQIVQVKEKFGCLRVYVDYPTNNDKLHIDIDKLISVTEQKCSTICEVCGDTGTLRTNGWWKTLCDNCTQKRILQRKLEFRKSFIINKAKELFGKDYKSWNNLTKEKRDIFIKKS